jgi:hypothetical protein
MILVVARRLSIVALACLITPLAAADDAPAETPINFIEEIRPILSNTCFECHGPDANARQAELRLDKKEDALADRGGYFAIVPGNPAESELIKRVTNPDPAMVMPPSDSRHPRLTPDEIDLLTRWIAQGAPWQEHWAFVTPERPALPDVSDFQSADGTISGSTWPRNGIDHFTLLRMRERGLEPSAEASRETLIRRVTLDLTGLPPTPAEVEAFLNDPSADAYEKVVDRLLASPRYGEHMTRYWLDAARYGDTHGLHLDNIRSIWPYRDWLIKAFNDNMPFDQMTVEQIAGDLLPNPTTPQIVATGFNRCNVTTSEGGSIAEEYYVRYAVDRVETLGTVYLGLTVGCAVCHDHKFDPISQNDFYGLFAYYNSFNENPMDGNALLHPPFIEVPTPEQIAQREQLNQQIAATREQINSTIAALAYVDPLADADPATIEPAEHVWIEDAGPEGAALQQVGHEWEFVSAPEPVYTGQHSTKRSGEGLLQHFFTGATRPLSIGDGDKLFTYVYLDPENPPKEIMLQWNDGTWEHRAFWGEDVIPWGANDTASKRRIGDLPAAGEWVRLEVSAADVGLVPAAKVNGWAFTQQDGTVYWDHAGLITRTPQEGQSFESQRLWELAVGSDPNLPQPVKDALAVAAADRNDDQKNTLRIYFLENVYPGSKDAIAPMLAERTRLEGELNALNEAIPKTMVSGELPEPKPSYVLYRGEYDQQREEVARHLPGILPPLPEGAPNNRLGLAQWLVHPSHPLMSRVTVNRWWQRYFGTGLVKTSEDFGIQGDAPTHPLLLDWLATELVQSGWNVKAMQKLIVTSATYRQQSASTPRQQEVDPDNRFLSHGPRFRMEAEMIRDQALFVSGLLVEKLGGPSVKPYQPGGLWEAVGYTDSNTANFTQDDGEALYRRSMYTFWKRTSPPPQMATLDAPSRESCTVRRPTTNTPLQALALMNDKQFVESARHFAQRIIAEGGGSDDERLAFAFMSVTSRGPDDRELTILRQVLAEHRADFESRPAEASAFIDAATTLMQPNHLDRDRAGDPELAAWTMLANLLMNLDEAITKG